MWHHVAHGLRRDTRTTRAWVVVLFLGVVTLPLLSGQGGASPEVAWERTYGGVAWDATRSVRQTYDGGFIIAGFTWSFGAGNSDAYLVKTDAAGNLQWQRPYGGPGNDYAWSVQQTQDSGFIIAGYTESYGAGEPRAYLVKTDATGNLQWYRTFGVDAWAFSVQQTRDGGFVIAGSTASQGAGDTDVYLIKTDAAGDLQWYQTYGGAYYDAARWVQQAQDGGFIIAGSTASFGAGETDVYLLKTDVAGNLEWQRTYGGPGAEHAWSGQETQDGGFIIAGDTKSYAVGETDVYMIKTDALGNRQWQRVYGGSSGDYAWSVQQTQDGGFIVAGATVSYGAEETDVYLVKTDAAGNLRWHRTYGGENSDAAHSVQQTRDGGYIIAGLTTSYGAGDWDVYLIRLWMAPSFRLLPKMLLKGLPGTWY